MSGLGRKEAGRCEQLQDAGLSEGDSTLRSSNRGHEFKDPYVDIGERCIIADYGVDYSPCPREAHNSRSKPRHFHFRASVTVRDRHTALTRLDTP